MKVRNIHCNGFRLRQWKCCGNLWELYLSYKFPERENWTPRCEMCGEKGKRMNDQIAVEQVPAPEAAVLAVVEGSTEGEVTVHVQTEAEVGAEENTEPRVLM